MTEQNLPTESAQSEAVEPHVLEELARMISERTQKGIETYGRPLSTFNGRDAAQDALEEIADAFQYVMQLKQERDALRNFEHQQLVFQEIEQERWRQDEKWGGPDHDDTHKPEEWRMFIELQIASMMPEHRMTTAIQDLNNFRDRLINIAALCVAAIQSLDRKKGAQPE